MPRARNFSLSAGHKLSVSPSLSFFFFLPSGLFYPSLLQENVEGGNCDRCKLGFYNLQRDNRRGCEKCFCMGVSSQCSASTWTYQNVGTVAHVSLMIKLYLKKKKKRLYKNQVAACTSASLLITFLPTFNRRNFSNSLI